MVAPSAQVKGRYQRAGSREAIALQMLRACCRQENSSDCFKLEIWRHACENGTGQKLHNDGSPEFHGPNLLRQDMTSILL